MDPFIEPLAELDVLDAAAGRLAVLAERMGAARLAEHAAMVIGHTAHPALTDLPIGFWTSAWLLDIIGGRRSRPAARLLIGVGIATALPTIATGLGDVPQLRSGKRRVVVVRGVQHRCARLLHGVVVAPRPEPGPRACGPIGLGGRGDRHHGWSAGWLPEPHTRTDAAVSWMMGIRRSIWAAARR